MCGLSAIFATSGAPDLARDIRAMTELVRHRGPDGEGYAEGNGWALGHRRLAIVELTALGAQPMWSADGKAVVIHNGEIYNHGALRTELERAGHAFRGHSDTEVILAAWRAWGPRCVERFNGMFAFVIVEPEAGRVFAARDRFGVKPLYWWRSPAGFTALASEIKQFTVLPGWRASLNPQRAYEFLNFGLTDHSRDTLFAGVHQLRGGECLDARLDELATPVPRRWYTLTPERVDDDFDAAADRFRELFTDSVRLRLQADVPVGTALSGGLDSTSIVSTVATLRDGQDGARHSFSARSHDPRFDEGEYIDEVISRCGTIAHHTYPELADFERELDKLVWHHDEPFSSASIYAEWEVFRLVATTPVKVTLDGHGADELLGGYHDFFKARFAGLAARGRLGELASEVRAARRTHGYGGGYLATALADSFLPDAMRQPVRRLTGRPVAAVDWFERDAHEVDASDLFADLGARAPGVAALSKSQLLATSLPIQLRWNDRDSMAHSIESRAPFLDYRLVEFALGCPDSFKLNRGETKRLLRSALADRLPPRVAQRRDKMGFVTPERAWITEREPERFIALCRAAVDRAAGIVNERAFERAVDTIEGRRPFDSFVWRLITFSRWLEVFSVKSQESA